MSAPAGAADAGAPPAGIPEAALEPWAYVPDPGWDGPSTDRLLAAAWSVHANSAWTKAYVSSGCPSHAARIGVVYYGSPVEDPEAARRGAEPHAGTDDRLPSPYILCVARLAEYKGLDILAMAFAEVLSAGEDVHLVLVGDDHSQGGLSAFLGKLGIAGRVRWLGRQPHGRVLELAKGCLFFVLPSRRESLGGALIEAMAAGKAVVATRTGGIPELVRHGREGLLVEPKDPAGLAGALLRLLRDPAERERLGAAGRERSRLFSWDRALEAYASAWASHPAWRPGAALGFAIWDSASDQTALAYAGNVARWLRREGRPFALGLWRSSWRERFREETPGGRVFRLGVPAGSILEPLNALLVFLQLAWLSRAEGIAVWHVLVLRYRRLAGLLWFLSALKRRPVVTLA